MPDEADEAIHGKRCQCGQYRVHSFGLLWAETEGVKWRHSVTLCEVAVPRYDSDGKGGWVLREPPAVNVPLEPCVVPCLVHQYNFELEQKHAALKVRLLDAQKRIAELEARVADLECQVLEWRHL